jgi:hypothetical protein
MNTKYRLLASVVAISLMVSSCSVFEPTPAPTPVVGPPGPPGPPGPVTPAVTPQAIVIMAQTAAKGLQVMWTQFLAAYPTLTLPNGTVVPQATVTQITNDINLAVTAANELVAGQPAATGAATIKSIEGYLNDFAMVVAGPPINGLIPPPYNVMVSAAAFALPLLEQFVASVIPIPPAASRDALAARSKLQHQHPMTRAQMTATMNDWASRN